MSYFNSISTSSRVIKLLNNDLSIKLWHVHVFQIYFLLDFNIEYFCLCKPVIWIIRNQSLEMLSLCLDTAGTSQLCHTSLSYQPSPAPHSWTLLLFDLSPSVNSRLNKTELIESVRHVLMESKELRLLSQSGQFIINQTSKAYKHDLGLIFLQGDLCWPTL